MKKETLASMREKFPSRSIVQGAVRMTSGLKMDAIVHMDDAAAALVMALLVAGRDLSDAHADAMRQLAGEIIIAKKV